MFQTLDTGHKLALLMINTSFVKISYEPKINFGSPDCEGSIYNFSLAIIQS